MRRRRDAAAATIFGLILGGMGLILWVQHDLPRVVSGFFVICALIFLWLPRSERQLIRIADGVVSVTERRWFGVQMTWEEPYFAFRGVGKTRYIGEDKPESAVYTLHLLHPDERKALVLHESPCSSVIDRLSREAAGVLGLPRVDDGSARDRA